MENAIGETRQELIAHAVFHENPYIYS